MDPVEGAPNAFHAFESPEVAGDLCVFLSLYI
jgi:hypothetical protein